MRKKSIKIIIEQDEDKWHAYCPMLEEKGASTYGNTLDEAFKNIKEVLYMTLANMKKKGDVEEIEIRIKDLLTGKSEVISEKEAQKRLNWNKKKKDI